MGDFSGTAADARKGQEKGKVTDYLAKGPPTRRDYWPARFRPSGVRPEDLHRETVHPDEKSAIRRIAGY